MTASCHVKEAIQYASIMIATNARWVFFRSHSFQYSSHLKKKIETIFF